MNLSRPVSALLASVLVLQLAIFFRLHDMQGAVPKLRTLMPATPETAALPEQPADLLRAHTLCLSQAPVWQQDKSQMDYCMMSASAGDPKAQEAVAQFYLNGSTEASHGEAYAWLRAVEQNQRDRAAAATARLQLGQLVRQLNAETVAHAEIEAAKVMAGYEPQE